ncbi:hypothetical protein F5884DRAFT_788454 [Xylogone sp. PMI_703]|nr:hypothetical protein F5884DRAFT_788454 [Xylogone sp. PMI_703]
MINVSEEERLLHGLLEYLATKDNHSPCFLNIAEDFSIVLQKKYPNGRNRIPKDEPIIKPKPLYYYSRSSIMPMLWDGWIAEMDRILTNNLPINIKVKNVDEQSLHMLKEGSQINDEVLEAYLDILRQTGALICTTRLLLSNLTPSPIDRNMTKEVIMKKGHLFIPLHTTVGERGHWSFLHLSDVNTNNGCTVSIFDSLGGKYVPPQLISWLKNTVGLNPSALSRGSPNPQQRNGSNDCGLFVLMGIRMISAGFKHLDQTEADEFMSTFRQRVLAELIAGHLDPSPFELIEYQNAKLVSSGILPALSKSYSHSGTGDRTQPISLDTPSMSPESISPRSPPDIDLSIGNNSAMGLLTELDVDNVNWVIPPELSMSLDLEPDSAKDRGDTVASYPINMFAKLTTETTAGTKLSLGKRKIEDEGRISESLSRQLASSFASEESILHMLREAVVLARSNGRALSSDNSLKSLFSACAMEDSTLLSVRRHHYLFASLFYGRAKALGVKDVKQPHRYPKGVKTRMKAELGIAIASGNQREQWETATRFARRGSVWVDLLQVCEEYLGDGKEVALCGVADTNTIVESMSQNHRGEFLDAIKARFMEPESQLRARLRTSQPLYIAVTTCTLPQHILAIEETIKGVDGVGFADALSLEALPKRRLLP